MALQVRRGTNAERLSIIPLAGELIFTTDTKELYIGDNVTYGGKPVTAFNSEDAQDFVAPMFTNGTHSGISFAYNDNANTINATVSVAQSLDSLTDVVLSNSSVGQVLKFNGTNWINSSDSVITQLSGLSDVSLTQPVTLGQVLKFNGTNWVNEADLSSVGLENVEDDPSPTLGGDLELNLNDIYGAGNITISGHFTSSSPTSFISLNENSYRPVNILSITDGTLDSVRDISICGARGSVVSPENTQSGDALASFSIRGYYNGVQKLAGIIQANWDPSATMTNSQPSSTINVGVGNNNGGFVIYSFNSTGAFSAPVIQTGIYAAASRPTTPTKGMIIFNDTTGQFEGWNGTSWTVLG